MKQNEIAKQLLLGRSCQNCFYCFGYDNSGKILNCSHEDQDAVLPKELICKDWTKDKIGEYPQPNVK